MEACRYVDNNPDCPRAHGSIIPPNSVSLTRSSFPFKRHAQALPHDRDFGVHEKPRICARACRTHTDTRDMEEAGDIIQSSGFGRTGGLMPRPNKETCILWNPARANIRQILLDKQEDSLITDTAEDSKEFYCPFELPQDEYGELMFERRLAMEGTASPDPSTHAGSRRGSTVADTDGTYITSLPWLSDG